MFSIQNSSSEDLELVIHVDPSVPGCRVRGDGLQIEILPPDDNFNFMGYEPGMSFTIRPTSQPERPRGVKDWELSQQCKERQHPREKTDDKQTTNQGVG